LRTRQKIDSSAWRHEIRQVPGCGCGIAAALAEKLLLAPAAADRAAVGATQKEPDGLPEAGRFGNRGDGEVWRWIGEKAHGSVYDWVVGL
jgi:hypothetical protein